MAWHFATVSGIVREMQDDFHSPKPVAPAPEPIADIVPPAPTSTEPPHVTATLTPRPVDSDTEKKEHKADIKNTIVSVLILLMAPLIAVFLTAFVFQSYQVDGPSMETTLYNNDRLIVWKAPRTLARITHHQYVPNRGDVIIFDEPGLGIEDGSGTKQLVKRVVGLPGERVVIKNSEITVYSTAHPEGFDPDKTLPYGSEHSFPVTEDDVDVTLTSTQLFVLGDNRTNSLDSRAFGPIETHQVVGKLAMRILPLSKAKIF